MLVQPAISHLLT